jgi:hypothetical protein
MVIPAGISSSSTKNLTKECLFRRELLDHRRGIYPRKVIPPGIISSNRLVHTDKIKMRGTVTIPGSAAPNPLCCQCQSQKIKYENVIEMKHIPNPALLRPSYLSNYIKKYSQISLGYPFKRKPMLS